MSFTGTGGLADGAAKAVRAAFGQSVTFTRSSDDTTSAVTAIFDERSDRFDAESGEYRGSQPMVEARLSDVSFTPVQDDRVTANGADYAISDVEPDSLGLMAKYWLRVIS